MKLMVKYVTRIHRLLFESVSLIFLLLSFIQHYRRLNYR